MANRTRSLALCAVAFVLVGALLISSCTPAATEDEIVFGNSLILTGAIADVGVPGGEGQLDYQMWVNDNGGINGIPINPLWMDCRSTIPGGILNYKRMKVKGMTVFQDWISGTNEALSSTAQRDELPLVFEQDLSELMLTKPIPWIFGAGPGFDPRCATFMKWVKENWKEDRPPRIGAIIYDQGSALASLDAFEHADEFEVEYLGHETLPFLGAIDTSVEILRMLNKKPDWIWTVMCGATSTTFAMDCQRLDVIEKGVNLFDGLGFFDEPAVSRLGEAAEGWNVTRWVPYASSEGDLPGMKDLFDAAQKYRGHAPEEISAHYVVGWLTSQVMVEGTRLAIENVGFDNLNGKAVRDGLASIKDFETGLVPPITMTDDKPLYVDGYKMYKVRDGRVMPISDWIKPPYYLKPQ